MAERNQLTRLSSNQLSDGDKLMERIGDERATNLRLKDKIKVRGTYVTLSAANESQCLLV